MAAEPYQPPLKAEADEDRSLKDRLEHPFEQLRQRFHDSQLNDLKVKATVFKHKIGKFGNLVNPNHLHDEEHEENTDKKRTFIAQSHRFASFAPLREANKVKWYVDGRDYFWVCYPVLQSATQCTDGFGGCFRCPRTCTGNNLYCRLVVVPRARMSPPPRRQPLVASLIGSFCDAPHITIRNGGWIRC
jgi:hypothetical protein